MGCSPSKGNNFGTEGPFKRSRLPLPGPEDGSPGECHNRESGDCSGSADRNSKERTAAGPIHSLQREQKHRASVSELSPEAVVLDTSTNQAKGNKSAGPQGKEIPVEKLDTRDKKAVKKPKKNNRGTKSVKKKEKDKKIPLSEQKVDFPEPLVKAHQATYGFLNPSISKYEVLLGLLEQATQTQVSVQPMVAFMALRYEEINQALEEMADEGEKLLKESGEHLAWPSEMKNLSSSTSVKSGVANIEPPPDLLQQLLQYTTQRMQNVIHTVGGIGDSALEEAIDYFASVSELLEEKLHVKHATEARLLQLLTRIEAASLHKPGPEDSALFSEDSGIGAESESLAGSERHLRRRSCESTGTVRTTNSSPMGRNITSFRQGSSRRKLTCKISPTGSLTSIDSTCTIMANEQNDTESLLGSASLDDREEDENAMDGDRDISGRRRSNSSPVDHSQAPRRLPPKRIENPQNVQMTLKMKDAISGRIQFVQHTSAKAKITQSPKNSRRQWTEEEEHSQKRPLTAAPTRMAAVKKTQVAREQRSSSAESLRSKAEDPTLLELEKTQRVLNQRLERMNKGRAGSNTRTVLFKQNQGNSPAQSPAINRRHPSLAKNNNAQPSQERPRLSRTNKEQEAKNNVSEAEKKPDTSNSPIKATPTPTPPSSPQPFSGFHRGRNSVKKLIDSFSQGRDELEGPRVLGPLKGVLKCGVPVLPGLGNVEAVLSTGVTSCRNEPTSPEKNYDLDLESFPPPPLEVLMDNSFEGAQSLSASLIDDGASKGFKSPTVKRAAVSQRLRASVQSVTVLPCKGSLPQASRVTLATRSDQAGSAVPPKTCKTHVQPEMESGKATSPCLSKQARKIIHLQSSTASTSEKSSTSYATVSHNGQAASVEEQDSGSLPAPAPPTFSSNQPPASPSLSKARMLPFTPSNPSTVQQRITNPQALRRKNTPSSSTSPPAIRKLPTPPPAHRRLPSPPVVRPNISNTASSYPIKAPSPPASPKIQRWSRASSSSSSSNDSSASRLINNARSVFCPASPSLFEAQPCPVPRPPQAWMSPVVSVLPRPWGNRGRFPVTVRGPRPFIRRSHSDRRPSLTLPPRSPCHISVAQTCGSEPSINTHGLEDEPIVEDGVRWGSQSELRATVRSVSHLDLCIVGQGLR